MKKTALLCLAMLLLASCASYYSRPLEPSALKETPQIPGISIGCREFTREDCLTYLDRNVIDKGYLPLQLTFYNNTQTPYVFTRSDFGLPTASAEEVAKLVHTSTAGRVFGYTVGSLVLPPLLISAIVDGIKSHGANTRLDNDFTLKAKNHLVLHPGVVRSIVLFVPIKDYVPLFDITLIDQMSAESTTFKITTTSSTVNN